ncbi:MAG: RNA methyltransferase, partial [Coriobacteriales bacterium]|nr:RNA methyltransferase [Coriobacteriales bacterium]
GAIIRSAEVVGASGLVIPANRSASVSEATFRTSAGAVEHLPIAKVANLVQAIQALKEADFWIAAADQHAAQDIWQSNLKGRIGLVLGAEDSGISERVATACDFSFRLPQRGHTESLNVSAAAAAIAFEWMRQNFDQGQAPA